MPPLEMWLVILGIVTLLARIGICLYLTGMSRSRNAATAVMRSMADACVAVLAFWAVGYAILSPGSYTWFGIHNSFGAPGFFYATTILLGTGAALGGTLGRTRMTAPLCVSVVLAAIVIPVAGRWVWWGWLHDLGFIDIGGAAPLHLCGAMAALSGAIIAGPRGGKYNRDGSANLIPGHSVPLMAAGALALLAGIIAQIVGYATFRASSPGDAAANAMLAAAAGGCGALMVSRYRYRMTDIHLFVAGMLAGLISSAAGAGQASSLVAAGTGLVAGVIAPLALVWLDLRLRVDDPSSAAATHFVGGAVGLLAVVFAVRAASPLKLLAVQLLGIIVISALAVVCTSAIYLLMKRAKLLRLSEADELDGDDLVEHDLNAYPDFQQTMIKSYHLRET